MLHCTSGYCVKQEMQEMNMHHPKCRKCWCYIALYMHMYMTCTVIGYYRGHFLTKSGHIVMKLQKYGAKSATADNLFRPDWALSVQCSTRWACHVSLVPTPIRRRKKGLVHIARACAGVSIATSRVSMVIAHRFCMMCSSMDDIRTNI